MNASSTKKNPGDDPRDPESLVAYLDGEVDESSSEAVEAEIARNPQVRVEIDSLQRAWDLLEYLDRPSVKGNFTSRTLELATRSIPAVVAPLAPKAPWPGPRLWAASIVILALLGGVAIWLRPLLDSKIEAEIPILERLDVYRASKDLDFLKQLEQQSLLDQMDQLLEPE